MEKLVVFQNYFTPYRWALFQELGKYVDLTVFYLHKPQDEGRKWEEKEFSKSPTFKTVQLEYKKFGPVIWPKMNKTFFAKYIDSNTETVFLDNLPTNIAMLRTISVLKSLVPYKNRALWVEHQWVKETQNTAIPFFNQIKFLYKIVWSWLLAFQCNTLLSFSDMSTEYLKKLWFPMGSQKIVRTVQSAYTEEQINEFLEHSTKNRVYDKSTISFGFLGYFSARKGIKNLLTAIKFYTNPHASFIFVGDGPEKELIASAAKADKRIALHPYVVTEQEKTDVYLQMDVNVIPSEKDPWCLVVNEAASRAVPSIVSPNVGAKEMMTLVSPELVMLDNEPLSIAKAMNNLTRMKQNKAKWEKLLKATAIVAQAWNIEKSAKNIMKITSK
jgi:glycosyltransferase involved in cell wall biosynthesis